ncbi:MAG: hypothetical protein KGH75_03185 [Rhodospirillales bacterium]|nr:hypothetical protein [Rhodospirillales bacterium]
MTRIFDPTQARISEIKIFENCVSSLKTNIGQIAAGYGKSPWPVSHVAGSQAFREMARQQKIPELPFLGLIITAIKPSEEGYNNQAMYNGFYMGQVGSETSQPTNIILHVRPVAIEAQIIVYTQTFSDVSDFAQRWLFRERDIQFSLNTKSYNLPIKVVLTEDLAIPEEDFSEMGNLFAMQAGLTMYAYVGVLELQPSITKVEMNLESANLDTKVTQVVTSKNIEKTTNGLVQS